MVNHYWLSTSFKKGNIYTTFNLTSFSVLILLLLSGLALEATAQAVYPKFNTYTAPSPAPAPPGELFTAPTMSGTASSNAPACAEWTRTAGPDETMVITGVNFSNFKAEEEGRDTRFSVSGSNGQMQEAKIQRLDRDKAIVTLDKALNKWGMYLLWPGNESGYGTPIAINQTDAWWVGPEKATRGSRIAVYGRNLAQNNDTLTSFVYIKPANSAGQYAEVKSVNPYKVEFTVPATLTSGDYEVWTHNGHGGQYGWSGPLKLTVYEAKPWTSTVLNVKDFGAKGNGSADDTQAIQNAIDAAGKSSGSTVYLPDGVYLISNTLHVKSNMRLSGGGKHTTIIQCAANFSSQASGMLSGNINDFLVENMAFVGNHNFRGTISEPIYLRFCTNIAIQNVKLSFQGYHTMNLDGGYRIFVKNTEFTGKNAFLGTCSQLFIDNCVYKLTNDSETALHSWGGKGISLTNSTCQDFDNSNPNDGSGWGKGRFFTGNGNFGGTQFTYIGNNVTKNLATRQAGGVDQNSGEQLMWEGFTAKWYGAAASSTLLTTSLTNFSPFTSTMQMAVIVKGKGLGQSRRIVSVNGSTITLESPWNVMPDPTSIIAVGNFADRIAIYNNTLTGKPYTVTDDNLIIIASTGIEPFSGTFNFIAANNTIKNLRSGLANWATQHEIGVDPNYFSLYTDNKLLDCRWGIQNGLYNIKNTSPKGTGMLGVTYRNNFISNTNQSGIINSLSDANPSLMDGIVYEHNNFSNVKKGFSLGNDTGAPTWFAFAGAGLENQLFYKNNFSSNGGGASGIITTPKVALRENSYTGFGSNYSGVLPAKVIEAPHHVKEIAGNTGGNSVEAFFTLWNSGVKAMEWKATANVPWLTLPVATGSIKDEKESYALKLIAHPAGLVVGTHKGIVTLVAGNEIKQYTILFKITSLNGPKTNILTPATNTTLQTSATTTITANATTASGTITKVEFFAGGLKLGEDESSPYSFTWANSEAGTFSLTTRATDSNGLTAVSERVEVTVSSPVTQVPNPSPSPVACSGTGSISWDYWANIPGVYNTSISSIPVNSQPTNSKTLPVFAAPVNFGSSYGARIRGYICPPTDGNYVFYLSTDDNGELWLSTDENPATKQRIAYVEGHTEIEQYDKFPSQQSRPIFLKAGQRYYVEALHKEATLGDHLSVGWKLPNGTLQRPIAGAHLIPFTSDITGPLVSIISPAANTTLLTPATTTITATATPTNAAIRKVEFFAGTTKLGEDFTSPYSFTWVTAVAGNYFLTAKATDSNGLTAVSERVEVEVGSPVKQISSPTACSGTGSISWEYWANIPGIYNTDIASIPLNSQPTSTKTLHSFATPVNYADNYGARVRGYICPPADGNYIFYLASDDNGELWLSTDDNPATKQKIAFVDGFTDEEQYDKFASQESQPIFLKAGQRYYIEALHKEATLGDHLSVGWKLPNGTLQRPIAGAHLMPFTAITVAAIACMATGTILHEQWNNLSGGTTISSIPVNNTPTSTSFLTVFEAPTDVKDNYGSRIRGYICPPQTGNYTFWIAGDDDTELWLSLDDNPLNKKKIAGFTGWTNPREWTKFPSQKSEVVTLQAGRRYYIEALHKESDGGDNLAVAWQLPNGSLEAPVAGARLSPFLVTSNQLTTRKPYESQEIFNQPTEVISAFPNPFAQFTTVQFSVTSSAETKLELYDAQGKLVNRLFSGMAKAGVIEQLTIDAKKLTAGMYLIKLITGAKVLTKKIILTE